MADGGLKALGPDDVAILKEMVRWFKNFRFPKRADKGNSDDIRSSDTYIAQPQSANGIPALSGTTPGKDVCDIYQIDPNGGGADDPRLVQVGGIEEKVYNLSASVIAQTEYVPVHRNRYGRWIVGSSQPSDHQWFELKNELPDTAGTARSSVSPGQEVIAHPRDWNGSAWVTDTAGGSEYTVVDELGVYRGRGRSQYSSPHNQGSLGRSRFNSESGEHEIVQLEPHALMIRGTTTGEWTAGSFNIDTVKVMQPIGAIITDYDPADDIPINDFLDFEGSSSDVIVAVWDEEDVDWKLLQKAC